MTAGATHTLTATLKDASGNTLTGDNTTVVTFAKTGGAGTVTGLGTATASAGVATKSVTNQLAGQIDLDAQVAGMTTGTGSYTIVVGPVSAATLDGQRRPVQRLATTARTRPRSPSPCATPAATRCPA